MEFKQITDLTTLPPEILFNFEELKNELSENLEKYKGLVVTEDGIKAAKGDRAALNRLEKAINDQKIAIKKECNKPVVAFENKVKVLTSMISEASNAIDKQVKAFEDQAKETKKNEILAYYEKAIGDLKEIAPFDRIFVSEWLNTGTTIKSITAQIDKTITKINTDLALIDGQDAEYVLQCKDKYLQGFDLSAALAEVQRLKERKKQMEEYQAKQKIVEQIEETPKDTIQQVVDAIYIPNIDVTPPKELTKTIKVVFYDTTEAFRSEMKSLTIKHKIRYGGIE